MDGLDQALHNEIFLQNEDDGRSPVWKYPNEQLGTQTILAVAADEGALLVVDGKIVHTFQPGTFDLPPELLGNMAAKEQKQDVMLSDGFYFVRKYCPLEFRYRVCLPASIFGIGTSMGDCITVAGEYRVGVEMPEELKAGTLWMLLDHSSAEPENYLSRKLNDCIEQTVYQVIPEVWDQYKAAYRLWGKLNSGIASAMQYELKQIGLELMDLYIEYLDFPDKLQECSMMKKAEYSASYTPYAPMMPSCPAQAPGQKPFLMPQESTSAPLPETSKKKRTGILRSGMSAVGSVVGAGIGLMGSAVGAGVAAAAGAAELLQKAKSRNDDTAGKKVATLQNIQISAVAPKKFIKGDYSVVRVLLYEEAYRHIVDAVKTTEDQETRTTAQVPENALVRVRLTSPDLEIEDDEQESLWTGKFQEFGFAVMLPINYPKRSIQFRAMISVNGVPATRLTFVAKCSSLLEQKLRVVRQDILSAFVSYASADREDVVRVIQGMRKARPDMDIFFDVEKLRSGQNWKKALYSEIDQRDLLVLCWSRAAKKSEWVDREWRYAMAQKGVDCIDPVPLEPAEICPPPDELDGKHFNDNLLYIRSGASSHWGDAVR